MIKHIQAGALSLRLTQGAERLDALMGFASRQNEKRSFLFVSKVLGKHIPVKPSTMRAVYNELADLCSIAGDTYVVGMAETATGLGAGVADSLAHQNPDCNVFYQHTTRHEINQPVWFTLNEVHSHAVDHILYQPSLLLLNNIQNCNQLVLVDDEMTTGRTLLQLAQGILDRIPSIQSLTIVTLVSWLQKNKMKIFENFSVPVTFVQLVKGVFTFEADPEFNVTLPDKVDDGVCTLESRQDAGRLGIKMPVKRQLTNFQKQKYHNTPVVVVGFGEYLYFPFLLAEQLEKITDVVFQSTTRSPILLGDAIERKTSFPVYGNKVNYIYNMPKNRETIFMNESEELSCYNGLEQGLSCDEIVHEHQTVCV